MQLENFPWHSINQSNAFQLYRGCGGNDDDDDDDVCIVCAI